MPQTKNIAILQARMGSSRLPGKMMKQLAGRPLIDYALERLCSAVKTSGMLDAVVLATSTETNNDPLVEHVLKQWPQVIIVRGPEQDVLSRFIASIHKTNANVVVRATGDCPFVNIQAMQRMIEALRGAGADIINYQPGYEYVDKGLEVVSAKALLRAGADPDLTIQDREHVTSLIYRNPDRYLVQYIESDLTLRRGDIRLTVDTADDLRFFECLIQQIPIDPCRISLNEIVSILDQHPDIAKINFSSGRKSTRHERARLGFRCDGGMEIGLGHIVGSIRLAKLLAKELGMGAEFVVRENFAAQALIKDAGFSMEVLPQETSPKNDIHRLVEKKKESDWSGVVINFCKDDLVRYTPFFSAIKDNNIPLIFMDNPLPPSCWLGDLLINALPHSDYEGYEPDNHPACLDGLENFLPGFDEQPPQKNIKPKVERVLVAMGGGDKPNLTSLVLRGLSEVGFKGYVDVVIGAACPHFEDIQKAIKELGLNGSVLKNVSDLHHRMIKADIGFSGLGLTAYEMAYCGLPACIVSGSKLNANSADKYVQKYNTAEHLGYYRNININYIKTRFITICNDKKRRSTMSSAGRFVGTNNNKILNLVTDYLSF